jgi:hypothetical protein
MKNSRILTIISSSLLLSATHIYGKVATYPFRDRVQKSALIVEAVVKKQTEIPDYDLKDLRAFRMKSTLKVTKVYKAESTEADTITVFSHMNFICDTSKKLAPGRRYLLMLKPHGSGYADVNYGRGTWEIVALEPNGQFVVGDSYARTGGQSYEQFQQNLLWALSEKPSWPEKPAVSAEQAKQIALQALSDSNTDLNGFELIKQKLLNIASDTIGVAHKGDPMWLFHWRKPQARPKSYLPPGTFFYCYVHAHTGKTLIGPNLKGKNPPTRNIRLFLKTYPTYRSIYTIPADTLTTTKLTQQQFANLLPRLSNTFLKPKPSYTDNTTFIKAEFPTAADTDPVIFVMNPAGRIDFAGIISKDI